MKRPYNYINGEIIDVNNPEHQKIVILRNKNLEAAKRTGLLIGDAKVKVELSVAIECANCGTSIYLKQHLDNEEIFEDVYSSLPEELECHCCEASLGIYKDSYFINVPKPVLKWKQN